MQGSCILQKVLLLVLDSENRHALDFSRCSQCRALRRQSVNYVKKERFLVHALLLFLGHGSPQGRWRNYSAVVLRRG